MAYFVLFNMLQTRAGGGDIVLKSVRWFLVGSSMAFASAHAAELQVSGGQLTGALNVNVGGTLYDVQFVEGSCEGLFSGCDESSDFAFGSEVTALSAAQALNQQVFINGAQGNFDADPSLTLGCENSAVCFAIIPFTLVADGELVVVAQAVNLFDTVEDVENIAGGQPTLDTLPLDNLVWAQFALVSAVSEPGSIALLGLGLFGLGWRRLRRVLQ